MSTVMPGLIVNNKPQTTTTLLNTAAGVNGLQANPDLGLAETSQFRKEVSHLKLPFDDRYDSGIDSFKEYDLQVLREEEECENNEQCASYNSTVTERLRNLNINEQSDISEEICDDALSNECICDDVESCQCLTEDAFYQDDEGDTPLHSSIIYNSPKYAERFISCSPCLEYLNIQNKLRQTPMHLSVIMKQPRLTRQLVVAGANLEMQDHNGQTSLHLACKSHDYMECVRELTRPITDKDRYNWPGRFYCPSIPQNLELQNFEGYTCLHLPQD
ncbi:NF-kappa-B inhibitor epsilon-like [Anneissia japonica]|uniref:NF-kappa-B inhibitor epsilon-like n=1 Tax=Anneissia japonica TaxID=1529436 RepID=UPI001425A538|nr:NF-kappa-B inhibitor epsilon-like [Anneissia japonica]